MYQKLQHYLLSETTEEIFLKTYRQFFSIHEIEESKTLQWVFGASLLSFFATFYSWISSSAITVEAYQQNVHGCWPWFTSCGEWAVLHALPFGYSQTAFYMVLMGVMLGIVYFMVQRQWERAHLLLVLLFVWKFLTMFFLTTQLHGNYDYYHIILTFILLMLPYKLFFLQFVFVLFYFLAATIKIHEGWILGSYFTALTTGIPLFPNALAPVVTNVVIFMQMVGAWFLLSEKPHLQRAVLLYFIAFHLYSGIIVEYRYPITVLPTLLILFGPWFEKVVPPMDKKSIAGWLLVVFLFAAQFIGIFIPGDTKLTLEGNEYGLYMFEANHQCVSNYAIYNSQGSITASTTRYVARARNRCDPYDTVFTLKEMCRRDSGITRIAWTFDHSINGRPFYRIVDTQDACKLQYNPLGHNAWIQTPEEGAKPMGRPLQNIYY